MFFLIITGPELYSFVMQPMTINILLIVSL